MDQAVASGAELPHASSPTASADSEWSGFGPVAAEAAIEVVSVADSEHLRDGPSVNLSVVPRGPSGSSVPRGPSGSSVLQPRALQTRLPAPPQRPQSANSALWRCPHRPPRPLQTAHAQNRFEAVQEANASSRSYTEDSFFGDMGAPSMLPGRMPLPESIGRCSDPPVNSVNSLMSFDSSEVGETATLPNLPKQGNRLRGLPARPLHGLGDPDEVHSLPDLRSLDPWRQRWQPQLHNQHHHQTGAVSVSREIITEELRFSAQRLLRRLRGAEGAEAGGSSGTHRLFRTLTASLAMEDTDETFLCLVCFENHKANRRLRIAQCKAESHGCCHECAASFFRSRIVQGRVFELPCPIGAADGRCSGPSFLSDSADLGASASNREVIALATREEVEACLAMSSERDATLRRYHRFLQTKIDPSLRECPDCKHLCSPKLDADGQPEAEMRCSKCASRFCYFHAAAHRGSSCETYEVRLAAETKGISESFGAKDCPRCKRQTMKSGGCNHMTCQVCRAEWCWICSTHLTERGPHGEGATYWHYSEENVESGCQQFADAGTHPDVEEVRLRRRDRIPGPFVQRLSAPVGALSVMLLAIAALLALVFWLILYFICCWVSELARLLMRGAYRMVGAEHSEHLFESLVQQLKKSALYAAVLFGMVAFLVPFFVLTIVWDALATVLWACLAALGQTPIIRRFVPATSRHHLRFLASAPLRAVHRFGSTVYANMQDERNGVFDDGDMLDA